MQKEIIEIIKEATCRECGAIYGYEEHDQMVQDAAQKIMELELLSDPLANEKVKSVSYQTFKPMVGSKCNISTVEYCNDSGQHKTTLEAPDLPSLIQKTQDFIDKL